MLQGIMCYVAVCAGFHFNNWKLKCVVNSIRLLNTYSRTIRLYYICMYVVVPVGILHFFINMELEAT